MIDVKWNEQGLVPAVVQDFQSKEVLMLAYMNEESLAKTVETGQTWFYSRSRKGLWNKGATSGHVQHVRELSYDCDADTLLVKVDQTGAACHTGKYSCFYRNVELLREVAEQPINAAQTEQNYGTTYIQSHGAIRGIELTKETIQESQANVAAYSYRTQDRFAILSQLENIIAERDAERPEGAYTTYLFENGIDKILKKIGEEAGEVIIAAKNRDAHDLRYEVSDLLFHVLVLLREQKLPLDEVLKELAARHLKRK
jgi:phosphoribosyl-ATP pyrophosphohydrolase/phosphoribosyl-AMP cyclohydrolase